MIDIKQLLQGKESVNVEVKAALGGIPSSVWETYSSFANTFGGTIVLGIGEDKTTKKFIPYGVKDSDKMLKDIWNILNNSSKISKNILLEDQVYVLNNDGLNYIVIEVPRANRNDRPIYVGDDMFKGCYKRNLDGDYHCAREEVKAMLRDQSDTSNDSLVLDNVDIDVLNKDSIKNYRLRFNNIKQGHVYSSLPNDQFLIKIGAAKIGNVDYKIHPTLAGLIFFGNYIDIIDQLPNYFLDYREKSSNDNRWSDRVCCTDGDWSGNIFDFYFRVIDRLTSDVKRPFMLDGNLMRVDDTPVHRGLRECLANALIHADYYGRRGIVIDKQFRKVTISNPGLFRIDINEAIAGGISDARNSRIFNMFSLINVGERSGSGICDVYNTWEEKGYKKIELKESVNPDRVTITLDFNDNDYYVEDVNDVIANYDASAIKDRVYKYACENRFASTKQMADYFNVSTRTIQRAIKQLEEKGLIINVGNRNNVEWRRLK